MIDLKNWIIEKWYYIDVYWWKILLSLGVNRSIEKIPNNTIYCYEWDDEKNKKEPINGYWIKPCKYYRSFNEQLKGGCTYTGFIGYDASLGDQCKICGEKEYIEVKK